MNGRNGLLKVTVFSAKNLYHTSLVAKEDPYVFIRAGETTDRSQVHSGGGINPVWNEPLELNLQHPSISIEKGNLDVEIWDKNIVKDTLMGSVSIPLRLLVDPNKTVMHWYPALKIKGKKTVHGGEILIQTEYHEPLVLHVHRARRLPKVNWFADQNPRCVVTVGSDIYRGQCIEGGGQDPQFRELFVINPSLRYNRSLPHPLENQYYREIPADPDAQPLYIDITVETVNSFKNTKIGFAYIPFHTLVQNDGTPQWFTIGTSYQNRSNAGEVLVSLHPYGIIEAMEERAREEEQPEQQQQARPRKAARKPVSSKTRDSGPNQQREEKVYTEQKNNEYNTYYDEVKSKPPLPSGPPPQAHCVHHDEQKLHGDEADDEDEYIEISADEDDQEEEHEEEEEEEEEEEMPHPTPMNRMDSVKGMHEMMESVRESNSDLKYEEYYQEQDESDLMEPHQDMHPEAEANDTVERVKHTYSQDSLDRDNCGGTSDLSSESLGPLDEDTLPQDTTVDNVDSTGNPEEPDSPVN